MFMFIRKPKKCRRLMPVCPLIVLTPPSNDAIKSISSKNIIRLPQAPVAWLNSLYDLMLMQNF